MEDFTIQEINEFRVASLKIEYIMLNDKHYIIVPSVYFMTVLDITEPRNISLHNNLPL